jgi:hypothetical protein
VRLEKTSRAARQRDRQAVPVSGAIPDRLWRMMLPPNGAYTRKRTGDGKKPVNARNGCRWTAAAGSETEHGWPIATTPALRPFLACLAFRQRGIRNGESLVRRFERRSFAASKPMGTIYVVYVMAH